MRSIIVGPEYLGEKEMFRLYFVLCIVLMALLLRAKALARLFLFKACYVFSTEEYWCNRSLLAD